MFENFAKKFNALLGRTETDNLIFYKEVLRSVRERQRAGIPKDPTSLVDCLAAAASAAQQVLYMQPFDVQVLGAIAMAEEHVAEMQTGEGKTLTAVMPVTYFASQGLPVHVLTANDYLAKRDAEWMGPIYRHLGFSVGYIQQGMNTRERHEAYACDVLYATPNEVGFDYLRDSLALTPAELVQREFGVALVDEADSILIDEARIPLVIAGGDAPTLDLVKRLASIAQTLTIYADYNVDPHGRNVILTDHGAAKVEAALGILNIYDDPPLFTAVIDALHAHTLLRRDVDYLVKDGEIRIVDEFKGRVAEMRRWPAGLQAALEAKEGVAVRTQGRILGSITLQSVMGLYERLCGMTGTAITQAEELYKVYSLEVVVIPPNKPVIRMDQPDQIYPTQHARDQAVLKEIQLCAVSGRPVLVGTSSVAESELLSRMLEGAAVAHEVLNARDDASEAAIVAKAGERGAVTISTNMAGRGTDIQLGPGVAKLGGLYVIGTCRHEARRIDLQLRGRAGRQGDPGESRFFLSLQDELMVRFGLGEALRGSPHPAEAMNHIQRVIEGENLEVRKTLLKYDLLVEKQRRMIHAIRQNVLLGERECTLPRSALLKIDELWSDYIAWISEKRSGIHWISFGGRNPLHAFIEDVVAEFENVHRGVEEAILDPETSAMPVDYQRGATWTYVTTDQPLGDMNQRLAKAIADKVRAMLAHTR